MESVNKDEARRKAEVARGWVRVLELAERERRKREDGSVLRLVDEERAR